MNRTLNKIVVSFFLFAAAICTAEPLSGRWLLKSQEVGGRKTDPDPLTLRITPSGSAFEFAYSLLVNNVHFVSMRFTSKLDGTPADIQNADGKKIGTIKIMKEGASQYTVLLEGPNRPTATGKIMVSADGKALSSESDTILTNGTKMHTVQVFALQPSR